VDDTAWYRGGIEEVTGSVALLDALEAYGAVTRLDDVLMLEPKQMYGYDWHEVLSCRLPRCLKKAMACSLELPSFNETQVRVHEWNGDPVILHGCQIGTKCPIFLHAK
jgi:hypothetical protein